LTPFGYDVGHAEGEQQTKKINKNNLNREGERRAFCLFAAP
jgi:hypothetical protein